jgi:hypothetical protein
MYEVHREDLGDDHRLVHAEIRDDGERYSIFAVSMRAEERR